MCSCCLPWDTLPELVPHPRSVQWDSGYRDGFVVSALHAEKFFPPTALRKLQHPDGYCRPAGLLDSPRLLDELHPKGTASPSPLDSQHGTVWPALHAFKGGFLPSNQVTLHSARMALGIPTTEPTPELSSLPAASHCRGTVFPLPGLETHRCCRVGCAGKSRLGAVVGVSPHLC